jgi:hypothetical protein
MTNAAEVAGPVVAGSALHNLDHAAALFPGEPSIDDILAAYRDMAALAPPRRWPARLVDGAKLSAIGCRRRRGVVMAHSGGSRAIRRRSLS